MKSVELVYSQNTDAYGFPRNDLGFKLAPPEKGSYLDAIIKYWYVWPLIWFGVILGLELSGYTKELYAYLVTGSVALLSISVISFRLVCVYRINTEFSDNYQFWKSSFHCGTCGDVCNPG